MVYRIMTYAFFLLGCAAWCSAAPAYPGDFAVSVDYSIPGPIIEIDADTLHFQAVIEAGSPTDQYVMIDNGGTGEMNWRLATTTTWLTLGAIAGGAGETVAVGCDIAGLSTGTYDGAVIISDTNAINSPETLFVQCVLSSDLPYLKAEPGKITASCYASENLSDSIYIVNAGSGEIDWTAANEADWLTLSTSFGGDNDFIRYSISGSGINVGLYADTITVTDKGAFNSPLRIPIDLTVLADDTIGTLLVIVERGAVFQQTFNLKTNNGLDSAALEFGYDRGMISVDSFVVPAMTDSVMSLTFQNESESGRFSFRINGNAAKSIILPAQYYLGELWGTANDSLAGKTAISMTTEDSFLELVNYGRHTPVWAGGDIDVSQITAVDDPHEREPAATYMLNQNRPNPFNGVTTISYSTERYGPVYLVVYNILGQLVRTLVNGDQAAGPHTVVWDGRDSSGRDMASGIFFYKLYAADFSAVRKMVYLK